MREKRSRFCHPSGNVVHKYIRKDAETTGMLAAHLKDCKIESTNMYPNQLEVV